MPVVQGSGTSSRAGSNSRTLTVARERPHGRPASRADADTLRGLHSPPVSGGLRAGSVPGVTAVMCCGTESWRDRGEKESY